MCIRDRPSPRAAARCSRPCASCFAPALRLQGGGDGGVQVPSQGAGAEVRGHASVDRGGAGMFVSALFLNEAGIPTVLDQVGDICLLYTSDAADDLTRVDLGGRRIIK